MDAFQDSDCCLVRASAHTDADIRIRTNVCTEHNLMSMYIPRITSCAVRNSESMLLFTCIPSLLIRKISKHPRQLLELVKGMQTNNLIQHTHLLTGYMRSPTMLRAVIETLKTLRAKNPKCTYGRTPMRYAPRSIFPFLYSIMFCPSLPDHTSSTH